MFYADGDSDERIRDSCGLSFGVCEVGCGHRSGVIDERFGTTETHRQREYVKRFKDGPRFRGGHIQFEGDDSAESVHLRASEVVLWMALQSGIVDLGYRHWSCVYSNPHLVRPKTNRGERTPYPCRDVCPSSEHIVGIFARTGAAIVLEKELSVATFFVCRVRDPMERLWMTVRTKRIFDDPEPDDGARVLVDRLWPRGVSKDDAQLDRWCKSVAPFDDLREWYDHDVERGRSLECHTNQNSTMRTDPSRSCST